MEDFRYIALLRGINVGGNNIIKMTDLKACFEAMGLKDGITYIQSGNVIFSSEDSEMEGLVKKIEQELTGKFDYKSRIVLISQDSLAKVVKNAPSGFGDEPDIFRYDVFFLMPPLTPAEAIEKITLREGVDQVWQGEQVLYFSRLIAKAGQSYLNKLVALSIYKEMTVRNWNTTRKLLDLSDGNA